MNHLLSVSRRALLSNSRLPAQTVVRTVLNNSEWRPREEQPVTKEDIAATARKYNMLPEDYKPLPPEYGAGDMPDVAPSGRYLERSPWEDYDYPLDRQNWNEPRHPLDHVKYDKYRLGMSDENVPNTWRTLFKLLLLPTVLILGTYLMRPLELMTPTFRSPKLETGVVHYSFEKGDESGNGVRY